MSNDTDKTDFEGLYKEFWNYVFRICFSRLGDYDIALDAAQEVFIKAYSSFDSYSRDKLFKSWICQIAVNHCIDLLRAQGREKIRLELFLNHRGSHDIPSDYLKQFIVTDCLSEMESYDRQLVLMKYLEGYTWGEMMDHTGLTLHEVRGRVNKTMKQFEMCLEEKGIHRPTTPTQK